MQCQAKFLSTLSLRRATKLIACQNGQLLDFYPRSPCGERLRVLDGSKSSIEISIHALLAESDQRTAQNAPLTMSISIHALLAESDCIMTITICTASRFLSTLSLRRATAGTAGAARSRRDFYPRSPCGERRSHCQSGFHCVGFLSTLSLRRATAGYPELFDDLKISIHALLAESDVLGLGHCFGHNIFLSTLSLRRATQ